MPSLFDEAEEILHNKVQEIADCGGMPYRVKMHEVENTLALTRLAAGVDNERRAEGLYSVLNLAYQDCKFEMEKQGRDVSGLPDVVVINDVNGITLGFLGGEFTGGPPLRMMQQEVRASKEYLFPEGYNHPHSPIRDLGDGKVGLVMGDMESAAEMGESLKLIAKAHEITGLVEGYRTKNTAAGMFALVVMDKGKYETLNKEERGQTPDLPAF